MQRSIAVFLVLLGSLSGAASSKPADPATVAHVLNRIAFGARPGEVERIAAVGLDRYIDQQLHPDRLSDLSIAPRLAGLTTINMSSRDIAERIEAPQIEARKAKKEGEPPTPQDMKAPAVVLELGEQKLLRAVYSERQLQEVLTDFWFNHFNVDARKGPVRFMLPEYEREVIRPHVLGKFRELLEATAKSPAMLFYLDNWMSADPNGPHPQLPRPRIVRGPFGPLLVQPPPRPPAPNAPKGLNENYARELMELHTLGVDGGYSQKDVTEVARCFTGWTIDKPRAGGGFVFRPALHDEGQKIVLGHVIKRGGDQSDGERVLDILAAHPSTARFIATKLVRRFVSDVPPPSLVDRVAQRFRETDGDLREVLRTLFTAAEFLTPDASNAKMKTPFEFVVSALRATGADVQDPVPLVRTMQQFGMPLYQCQPPTGYKDTADVWINTGALVDRMNFALRLATGKLPGTDAGMSDSPDDLALRIGGPDFQRR